MKRTTIRRCHLLLIFIFFGTIASAHPGGHSHHGDGLILNSWRLNNGQTVKGNFSKGNHDLIVLEQEDGEFVTIPIKNLSPQDRELALLKLKKYERLNESITPEYTSAYTGPEGITGTYTLSILSFTILLLLVIYNSIEAYKKQTQSLLRMSVIPASYILLFVTICAFNKGGSLIDVTIPKTSTGFIDSAFGAYKPSVAIRWDEDHFFVASKGIPTHPMMVGITSWQQQVPVAQDYTGNNSWSIPLQPVYAELPLSTKTNFMKGAIAIAVNGVPIFNALNNRGDDALLAGELDNWGGHCGRADDYHYHAAPLHLSASSKLMPIAFAFDGFAVYGNKEPDGSSMKPLDSCHGHLFAKGVYHYHGTSNYPYVIGAMKGKVTTNAKTPAPENQILPQAFASPLRPPGRPLRGAAITAFSSPDTNTYQLNYKLGDKNGSVKYNWDNAGKYIFWIADADGNTSSSEYQKRKNKQ